MFWFWKKVLYAIWPIFSSVRIVNMVFEEGTKWHMVLFSSVGIVKMEFEEGTKCQMVPSCRQLFSGKCL